MFSEFTKHGDQRANQHVFRRTDIELIRCGPPIEDREAKVYVVRGKAVEREIHARKKKLQQMEHNREEYDMEIQQLEKLRHVRAVFVGNNLVPVHHTSLGGDIDLGTDPSREKTRSQEEYLRWLQKAVEAVNNRGAAIRREAFTIAKDAIEYVLRENGSEPADVGTDEIERLAVEVIANNPDITKEAERRVDQRSKMTAVDLISVNNGESS